MSKRDLLKPFRNLLLALLALTLAAGTVSVASAADFHSALCERSSDLKHWRCEVTCSTGGTAIASCPSQSAWGACGRQILRQTCGISTETPVVACQRKAVLAGRNLDNLKNACEQSFSGFDELLAGPFEDFPGLVYRPRR